MLRHQLALVPAALALAVTAGVTLTTDYEKERTLRIETKTEIEIETTASSFTRDGEEVERPGGGGNLSTDERTVVQLDTVLASDDGAPTKVKRVYETVEGMTTRSFGENVMEQAQESPFAGIEMVLTLEDGEVEIEVADGDEPDSELLEGHRLELALDALLPENEVSEDDTWELDADAIQRILGLDLNKSLFPPVQVEEEPAGEGRRGGRRGGGRRGGGANVLALLASDEWEGEATLSAESEDTDEGTGAVIEFTAECSGDLPEPEERGGRGGFSFLLPEYPEYGPVVRRENTFAVELEGRLVFSTEDGRPLHLEVEANVTIETFREFGRNDVTMTMESTQEGTLGYEVTVSVEKDE